MKLVILSTMFWFIISYSYGGIVVEYDGLIVKANGEIKDISSGGKWDHDPEQTKGFKQYWRTIDGTKETVIRTKALTGDGRTTGVVYMSENSETKKSQMDFSKVDAGGSITSLTNCEISEERGHACTTVDLPFCSGLESALGELMKNGKVSIGEKCFKEMNNLFEFFNQHSARINTAQSKNLNEGFALAVGKWGWKDFKFAWGIEKDDKNFFEVMKKLNHTAKEMKEEASAYLNHCKKIDTSKKSASNGNRSSGNEGSVGTKK